MATKKITPNQKQWEKEIRRLKQFIRRAEKRGFTWAKNVIPEKPARITKKAIARLQELTPEKLYKRARYTDTTGKNIAGEEGRKLERSIAGKRGAATRAKKGIKRSPIKIKTIRVADGIGRVLEVDRDMIRTWAPRSWWTPFFTELKRNDKNILENILEGAIRLEGEEVVAARMEEHAEEVIALADDILYGSGGKEARDMQNNFSRFTSIVYGRPLTEQESKDLADAQEYLEVSEEPQ